jgi:hypothetical protein
MEIAIIGLIQAVAAAIIGGLFARDAKKRKNADDKAETRAVLRAEESKKMMELMSASVNLGIATATALKNGQTNGETDTALKKAREAKAKYYTFINNVAAEQIAR